MSSHTPIATSFLQARAAASAVVLGLSFLGADTPADAQPITGLVVVGDSLSDTGNLFAISGGAVPAPPYFEGRFSNGPIWIDSLAGRLALGDADVLNLAISGATTTDVLAFQPAGVGVLSGGATDPGALNVVFAGANDYFGLPADPQQAINTATSNILASINALADLGGRRFLVPNLPDLGVLPRFTNDTQALRDDLTSWTITHNTLLAAGLDSLESSRPGLDLIRVDTFSLFADLRADPASFGFTNITGMALAADGVTVATNPNEFLFWDDEHPTAPAHALLANAAFNAIPAPSGVVVASVLVLASRRRRR